MKLRKVKGAIRQMKTGIDLGNEKYLLWAFFFRLSMLMSHPCKTMICYKLHSDSREHLIVQKIVKSPYKQYKSLTFFVLHSHFPGREYNV